MQELILQVVGHCRDCGDDLSNDISIWAPESWLLRYETDRQLQRGIDRAVVQLVLTQHKPVCQGRSATRQQAAQPSQPIAQPA